MSYGNQHRGKAPDAPLRLVGDAAGRLDVREVDLFVLAHRWWHGTDIEAGLLDRVFAAYMFRQELPAWLRHYARAVLSSPRIGRDETRRLGLDRLPGPPPAPRHGRLIVSATGAAFLALFVMLLGTTADPEASVPRSAETGRLSCAGGGPGLAALEAFAYGFAGKTPPPC